MLIHTDCRYYKGSMPCRFHKIDGRLCEGCQDYDQVKTRILIVKLAAVVIAEQTIRYKKPLVLFERYEVILEVTHWDDRYFDMTHTFSNPERVIAEGTAKGAIKSRNGVVSPAEVIAAVEQDRQK